MVILECNRWGEWINSSRLIAIPPHLCWLLYRSTSPDYFDARSALGSDHFVQDILYGRRGWQTEVASQPSTHRKRLGGQLRRRKQFRGRSGSPPSVTRPVSTVPAWPKKSSRIPWSAWRSPTKLCGALGPSRYNGHAFSIFSRSPPMPPDDTRIALPKYSKLPTVSLDDLTLPPRTSSSRRSIQPTTRISAS